MIAAHEARAITLDLKGKFFDSIDEKIRRAAKDGIKSINIEVPVNLEPDLAAINQELRILGYTVRHKHIVGCWREPGYIKLTIMWGGE